MRNAFTGYTYQQKVTFLLLTIMDVERDISKIEIETKTDEDDKFDDLIVKMNSETFHFQIKDIKGISISDLDIQEGEILIKGKSHKLSSHHNVIVVKNIPVTSDSSFLNLPCYNLAPNISVISLSREQIEACINNLLQDDFQRKNELDTFFSYVLDQRIWVITRDLLPPLKVFITELQEKSISISHSLLEFDSLLLIEGKPGVGKSHFVNTSLVKKYENNLLYRFWIGNQDRDYKDRLRFENFIRNLNIKCFHSSKIKSRQELFANLKEQDTTLIIDGLDHVENYNNTELPLFIEFIEQVKNFCKVIVLSRPLAAILNWEKHALENWNEDQTTQVLDELFHLPNYSVIREIFRLSQGYPIVVKYLAEHYKLHQNIPPIEQIGDLNSYYQGIIANEKGKHSLSLFLCSKSYIMQSEIELFIDDERYYVEEFIKEHPYLFDVKLNRVSLFHDSFNTYLRTSIQYNHKLNKVNSIVSQSILNYEKRFLSRWTFFDLSIDQKKDILVQYASINAFKKILVNNIDYEAIQSFYKQLREVIKEAPIDLLSVNNYYDLSLIFNLITREHVSGLKDFYYTYVKSLIAHGYTEEDITSSEYLFGMYYFVRTNNATLLQNITANHHYDTSGFYVDLNYEIEKEEKHISKHSERLNEVMIDEALGDRMNLKQHAIYIIENLWINNYEIEGHEALNRSLEKYLEGAKYEACYMLGQFLQQYNASEYYPSWILTEVYDNLYSYGYRINNGCNEYQDLSLGEFIRKFYHLGSLSLSPKIQHYIRLALLENRTIDIQNIYLYWTKFYEHKDYTLYGIPIALKTLYLEKKINLKQCVTLIKNIQSQSGKGNRHLLAEFVELMPPKEIIPFLEKNFDVDELQINWFLLPPDFINEISNLTYRLEEEQLIRYNSTYTRFEDIENVLYSSKRQMLERTLFINSNKVYYKEIHEKAILSHKQSNIQFVKVEGEEYYSNRKRDSQEKFQEGILSYDDIDFIRDQRLTPCEVAKCSDGYYTSISKAHIFEVYPKEQITQCFKEILYYSLTSKTKKIDSLHLLFYHPGNILSMIQHYRDSEELEKAIESFKSFMELSSFDLELN